MQCARRAGLRRGLAALMAGLWTRAHSGVMTDRSTVLRRSAVVAGLVAATAAGLCSGSLTLWLQGRLDGNWDLLANSGAVWTVVAVLTAATCGRSRLPSVAAGTLALVGEVVGYYRNAAPWDSIPTTASEQLLWTAAALVAGPLAGLAAYHLRQGGATGRVVSLLSVCGVVVGEGLYGLARIPPHRLASQVEIAIGLTVAVIGLLASRAPVSGRAAAIPLGAVIAAAVFVFYVDPVLV